MFYIIILFIMAIFFLPSLIMVLTGYYTVFEMIVLDGLTDPKLWIIVFFIDNGDMVHRCLGQGRHERQTWPEKENRIGLFDLNFKPLTYNSVN